MATKKTSKKPKKGSKSRRNEPEVPLISPEQKRDIAAVFLAVLALFLMFACFNFGGSLVTGLFHVVRVVVGFAAYVLPLVFAWLAWMLFQSEKHSVKGLNYFGFAGFLASLAA